MSESEYEALLRAYNSLEESSNNGTPVAEHQNIIDVTWEEPDISNGLLSTIEPIIIGSTYTVNLQDITYTEEIQQSTLSPDLSYSQLLDSVSINSLQVIDYCQFWRTILKGINFVNDNNEIKENEDIEQFIEKSLDYGYGVFGNLAKEFKRLIDENVIISVGHDMVLATPENLVARLNWRLENNNKVIAINSVTEDSIRAVMEEIFGESNCELAALTSDEFNPDGNQTHRGTFYWKDITISNSSGRTHQLRDVYIQVYFRITNSNITMYSGDIYLNRGMRSVAEYNSKYFHSHSRSSGSYMRWDRCCLGGDTPIAKAYASTCFKYTEDDFRNFLLCLLGYPYWESTEGTPYIGMKNILNSTLSGSNRVSISNVHVDLMTRHLYSIALNKNIFHIRNNQICINYDSTYFITLISNIIENDTIYSKYIGTGIDGYFYSKSLFINVSSDARANELTNNCKTIDRNQKIYYKNQVLTATFYSIVTESDQYEWVVMPEFIRAVGNELQSKLNNLIKNNEIYEFKRSQPSF